MSDKRKTKKTAWAIFAVITALIFMVSGVASGTSYPNQSHPLYLPLVKNGNVLPSVFGAEVTGSISKSRGVDVMVSAGTTWLRYNGVVWSEVEATKGNYQWNVLDKLKSQLAVYQEQNLNIIMVVRGTPVWAQDVPGSLCGPIKTSELPEFALFMHELVTQLSAPPYNVKYWEVGNEPDAPIITGLESSTVNFGCWGRHAGR